MSKQQELKEAVKRFKEANNYYKEVMGSTHRPMKYRSYKEQDSHFINEMKKEVNKKYITK